MRAERQLFSAAARLMYDFRGDNLSITHRSDGNTENKLYSMFEIERSQLNRFGKPTMKGIEFLRVKACVS